MSKALGRGLGALLPSEDLMDAPTSTEGVKLIEIDKIQPNPHQPRKEFNPEALQELADSIKSKGILQPILVEHIGNGYQIVAGERRFRAAKLAGLQDVPVLVKAFTDQERMEIALIENIQRTDLTPIEEARAYKQLMESFNLTQDEVAQKVGKQRSTVANSLRLLKLSEEIQVAVDKGSVSAGHARALLSVDDTLKRDDLYQRIISEGLSVRDTEAFATGKIVKDKVPELVNKEKPSQERTPELKNLEQKLIELFGTKVIIKGNESKGVVEIAYFNQDDLNRFIDVIETASQAKP